jgi:hypothetical protein
MKIYLYYLFITSTYCFGIFLFIGGIFLGVMNKSIYYKIISVVCTVIGFIIILNIFLFVKKISNPNSYMCHNIYPRKKQKYRKYFSDETYIGSYLDE